MQAKPPFRADQVGSLLRPESLAQLRARFRRGEVDRPHAACRRGRVPCAMWCSGSTDLGLQAVTDGEFRRDWWHLDFLSQLDGVTLKHNEARNSRSPVRASSRRSPPSRAASAARGRSWWRTSRS